MYICMYRSMYMYIYSYFIILWMKTCAIPRPDQVATKCNATILVAKVVLPPLVPPAAFATGQGMKINKAKEPLCSLRKELLLC